MILRKFRTLVRRVRAKRLFVRFWLKSMVYRLTPGGYGHYRRLRRCKDPSFDFEVDKHPLRGKHYGNEGWQTASKQPFVYRSYDNYQEYVEHQSIKFDEVLRLSGAGFTNDVVWDFRTKFYKRFRILPDLLSQSASILCLGARQGTEVEVLWDMGFRNALGIDLNPGPDNPYVVCGDFMQLEYDDESVDLVYSNCVDHAFDLSRFFAEHARVLGPTGFAMYEIAAVENAGSFESVQWDEERTVIKEMLNHFSSVAHVEIEGWWKWILLQKSGRTQCHRIEG